MIDERGEVRKFQSTSHNHIRFLSFRDCSVREYKRMLIPHSTLCIALGSITIHISIALGSITIHISIALGSIIIHISIALSSIPLHISIALGPTHFILYISV